MSPHLVFVGGEAEDFMKKDFHGAERHRNVPALQVESAQAVGLHVSHRHARTGCCAGNP